MNKIKVLVINSDMDGVGYHRLLSPYICFDEEDIQIDLRLMMDGSLPLFDERFMSQYKIIVANKPLVFNDQKHDEIFNDIIKNNNIKKVLDLDDYWILTNSHPNYKIWKEKNQQAVVEKMFVESDAITTTTEFLANKIREFNTNVVICPNAINLKEQQWTNDKKLRVNNKIRFLWGGGITHLYDLRLLKKSFENLEKDFLEKSQMIMCGYDLRMMTPKGMKKDDPRRSNWTFFENIFTNNRKWLKNSDYNQWLWSAEDNGRDNYGYNEKFNNEFYIRRWTKPILLYGTMYNESDVVLAPLKNNNTFNSVKSQLKIVEAGAHHCPIICSNYGPYTIDDIEGKLDGKQKGFLVDENTDDSMKWYECMKFYVENPDKIIEHGENLYEYVKENYNIDKINKNRAELFRKLCNE